MSNCSRNIQTFCDKIAGWMNYFNNGDPIETNTAFNRNFGYGEDEVARGVWIEDIQNSVAVDTIHDLRMLEDTPTRVFVRGYFSPDGGEFGSHIFIKGQNGTDNNGTIIQAKNATYYLQYDGRADVKWFDTFENALLSQIPLFLEDTITISSTIDDISFIDIVSFTGNGVIEGGDIQGINMSEGVIRIKDLTVTGFTDSAGNKDNHSTGFIYIKDGGDIEEIALENVRSLENRCLIWANKDNSNDFTPAPDTKVVNMNISSCTFKGGSLGISLRCCVRDYHICNNKFVGLHGEGRDVGGIYLFLDAQDTDDVKYDDMGNGIIENNIFEDIVNNTTTGDSTSGNNYETHGIVVSGFNIIIKNNILRDVTGNNYDCEGIYTKGYDIIIANNELVDSGSHEGSITTKGTTKDTSDNIGPLGGDILIESNKITYTRHSYDNNGTTVDIECNGIYSEVPNNTIIRNNTIENTVSWDILLNGKTDALNPDCSIIGNVSTLFNGSNNIIARGAFVNLSINNNKFFDIKSDNPSNPGMFFLAGNVTNRGISTKNLTICDNIYKYGEYTTSDDDTHPRFIIFNDKEYAIDNVAITNNTIDIQHDNYQLFYITGDGENTKRVVWENNNVIQPVNGVALVFGDNTPETFIFKGKLVHQVEDDTLIPFYVKPQEHCVSFLKVDAMATSSTTNGAGYMYDKELAYTDSDRETTSEYNEDATVLGTLNHDTSIAAYIGTTTGIKYLVRADSDDGMVTFIMDIDLRVNTQ